MAKDTEIKLDGVVYKMRANMSASRALVRKGIDPILITMQTGKLGYANLGQDQIVDIIYTAIQFGGGDIDRDAVEESIFDMGFINAGVYAADYIADLVLGKKDKKPTETDSGEFKKKN